MADAIIRCLDWWYPDFRGIQHASRGAAGVLSQSCRYDGCARPVVSECWAIFPAGSSEPAPEVLCPTCGQAVADAYGK